MKKQKQYSIIADHLGTPLELIDERGLSSCRVELDGYGRTRMVNGDAGLCAFRYQGQYEDVETGLYYNRFRYYDPEEGKYISQDPIGIESGEFNLYNYVGDPNNWIDQLGLHGNCKNSTNPNHVYEIVDKSTGELYKYGISGGKVRRDGKSYRAEKQVRALNNTGGNYESRIVTKDVSRQKALDIEQGKVNAYSVSAQRSGVIRAGRPAPMGTPISPTGNIKPPAQM